MAGVPDTAWSSWEILVTVLGSSSLPISVTALVGLIRRSAQTEVIAAGVKTELDAYRTSTDKKFDVQDAKIERQFAAVDAKMDVVRSDMATKHDLDRMGTMIMNSFRTSLSALGVAFHQKE
jgi:hypothetical protein